MRIELNPGCTIIETLIVTQLVKKSITMYGFTYGAYYFGRNEYIRDYEQNA